jgi:hypothetical protein
VEFGVVSPAWASTAPLDDGTRRVVADGLQALYDPDGLLAELVKAAAGNPITTVSETWGSSPAAATRRDNRAAMTVPDVRVGDADRERVARLR